jgi:MoaA/NifB/PqqE/SkfB family radical SAM enzyme
MLLNKFNSASSAGFCGTGETFLNPDLFAMARYAAQLRMKVLITTNGTLLHKRMDELLTSNIDALEISLKGVYGEDYAQFTGRKESEFYSIINSIEELSKCRNRPKLIISYVCDRKRAYNIPAVLEIAGKCSVDEIWFQNLIPRPELKNESDCLYEDDKQWVSKLLDSSLKESGRMVVNGPIFYCRDSTRRNCAMPFRTLRIGQDGGVSGCSKAIGTSLKNGNVFIDNDVFNSEHFRKIRDELVNDNIPLRYECLYCGIRCM